MLFMCHHVLLEYFQTLDKNFKLLIMYSIVNSPVIQCDVFEHPRSIFRALYLWLVLLTLSKLRYKP